MRMLYFTVIWGTTGPCRAYSFLKCASFTITPTNLRVPLYTFDCICIKATLLVKFRGVWSGTEPSDEVLTTT